MPAFLAPVDYTVSSNPMEVETGDFNGDDVLDLATVDYLGPVNLLLGNPDGTFQPALSSSTGGYPLLSLAVGDFNEDGKLDLATGSTSDSFYYGGYYAGIDQVIVLIGNGDGTFAPPVYLGPDLPAGSVATGDLNGDGHLDLVAADNYFPERSLSVLLGSGDGTFARITTYDDDVYLPSLVLADFNGDGNDDVVGGYQLFLSNGDGTLGEPRDLDIGYPWTVADFDTDGALDLAGASYSNGSYGVGVLRGNGDGSFQPALFFPAGVSPSPSGAADMNGDSVLDLVVSNTSPVDGGLTVLLGDGDGSFGPPSTTVLGYAPASVVVGDFNADGLPDAAMAEPYYSAPGGQTGAVLVLRNDGAWPLDDAPSVSIRDIGVFEGNTGTASATFTVTLSHSTNVDVTIHYTTADITAASGSDYTAASGDIVIPAGQVSATFGVAVKGDRLPEPEETFAVNLTAATGATIGDGQAIGTIFDNEPRISITDVSKAEGRKPFSTPFTFTVTLGTAYDQPVTVSFRTVNGTATTGNNDYQAKTGTLTFAPGETRKTVTIYVKGDNKREANEVFYLDLFDNSSNSQFYKNRGLGTILNDD